jgi:hypothetical protein
MTTYYTATTGDNGGAGTIGDPWQTIQYGYDQLSPGDTLIVRGGTYVEQVDMNTPGSAGNWIIIQQYLEEVVTVDGEAGVGGLNNGLPTGAFGGYDPVSGKGFKWDGLIDMTADYNKLIGIDVYRSLGRGIRTFGGDNIEMSKCDVSYSREGGILVGDDTDSDSILLKGLTVYRNCDFATYSRSSGVLDWPGAITVKRSDNVTIQNCLVYENWGEGLIVGVGHADNVEVYDSEFYDNYALQIYVDHGVGVTIERNLVWHSNSSEFYRGGTPSAGIVIENESWLGGTHLSSGITVKNNLIAGCGPGMALWCDIYAASDIAWINNTLIDCDEGGMYIIGKSDQSNLRFKNNLIYQTTGYAITVGVAAGFVFSHQCYYGGGTVDGDAVSGDDVTSDPLLDRTGSMNPGELVSSFFMIDNVGSPCINAGLDDADDPAVDYFALPRTGDPDMGGHEYAAAGPYASATLAGSALLSAVGGLVPVPPVSSPSGLAGSIVVTITEKDELSV